MAPPGPASSLARSADKVEEFHFNRYVFCNSTNQIRGKQMCDYRVVRIIKVVAIIAIMIITQYNIIY